jgi:hypothetical protein
MDNGTMVTVCSVKQWILQCAVIHGVVNEASSSQCELPVMGHEGDLQLFQGAH